MTHHYAEIMFTDDVKSIQTAQGSRGAYERFEAPYPMPDDRLSEIEAEFISSSDSFFMATVSETGWPYVQHRGGPVGFVKILDDQTIAFADFRGNRQYVSVGNLAANDRVSLMIVDYVARRRLKIIGHAKVVEAKDAPALIAQLRDDQYNARIERAIVISVTAFDWNCPQHISPRFAGPGADAPIPQRRP